MEAESFVLPKQAYLNRPIKLRFVSVFIMRNFNELHVLRKRHFILSTI